MSKNIPIFPDFDQEDKEGTNLTIFRTCVRKKGDDGFWYLIPVTEMGAVNAKTMKYFFAMCYKVLLFTKIPTGTGDKHFLWNRDTDQQPEYERVLNE